MCAFTGCADDLCREGHEPECGVGGDRSEGAGGSGGEVEPGYDDYDDEVESSGGGESDSVGSGARFCKDADGDGFGSQLCGVFSFGSAPQGYVDNGDDCDDMIAFAYPGAAFEESHTACMQDLDGDGWGDAMPPGPMTIAGRDCDDREHAAFPGAAFRESDQTCMQDVDGDGWGDMSPSASLTVAGNDCDDTDPSTFPGAAESESVVMCMKDTDGDGWGESTPREGTTPGSDCDDALANTFPGAAPFDDPSGCMKDADGDGWGDEAPESTTTLAGSDCDDDDAGAHPEVRNGEAALTLCLNNDGGDSDDGGDYASRSIGRSGCVPVRICPATPKR